MFTIAGFILGILFMIGVVGKSDAMWMISLVILFFVSLWERDD